MSGVSGKAPRLALLALLCGFGAGSVSAQQFLPPEKVPPSFKADTLFAARVRSLLLPHSESAIGQYAVGQQVLERLLKQLPTEGTRFSWELRIAREAGNVFSSPDGAIFVDEGLAQMLGPQSGLWAAALSHEISHVVRRDWARRYLFQQSLQDSAGSQIVLGQAGAFSASWVDPGNSASRLASFCQTMELEADAQSLMLMARAGFHPDFVPALHKLLQAQPGQLDGNLLDPSHPRWDERDAQLRKLYAAAGREYDRLWPARYASPGGDPPIVVDAGSPSAKLGFSGVLEVLVPLHCQNLSGSVEVVLRLTDAELPSELRQFTGCTSNRTLITFRVTGREVRRGRSRVEGEISVLDDGGAVLTRSLSAIAIR